MKKHKQHSVIPAFTLMLAGTLSLLCSCSSGNGSSVDIEPVVLPYGTEISEDGSYILPYGTVQGENGEYTVIDEPDIEKDTTINPISSEAVPVVDPEAASQAEAATFDAKHGFIFDHTEREAFESELDYSTLIPTLCIYTDYCRKIVSGTEYIPCIVDVINCEDCYALRDATAGIRLRGNSSAYYFKYEDVIANQVPYRIKFDTKTNVLGLSDGNKFRNWVLLKAGWELVHEDLTFRLGRAMMRGNFYCSDSQPVLVYVNGNYAGKYVLCEQNQVQKHRVNVTECPEDYKGVDIGYYFDIDNYCESPYFDCDYNQNAALTDIYGVTRPVEKAEYSIKSDIYSDTQLNFISVYVKKVYEVLYNACIEGKYYRLSDRFTPGVSPSDADIGWDSILIPSECTNARDTVSAVLDLDSVVDMYILHELATSCDCGEGSFYMCVDFAPEGHIRKLTFTTPWDFNWTAGIEPDSYFYAGSFRDEAFVEEMGDRSNPWFILLLTQDWFRDMVRERLNELIDNGTFSSVLNKERSYIKLYRTDLSIKNSWEVDTALNLIDWYERRIRWLADNL